MSRIISFATLVFTLRLSQVHVSHGVGTQMSYVVCVQLSQEVRVQMSHSFWVQFTNSRFIYLKMSRLIVSRLDAVFLHMTPYHKVEFTSVCVCVTKYIKNQVPGSVF